MTRKFMAAVGFYSDQNSNFTIKNSVLSLKWQFGLILMNGLVSPRGRTRIRGPARDLHVLFINT
jgi:hypothetical protein